MLPAPVQPKVLLRVAPDDLFQSLGVSLCEKLDIIPRAVEFAWLDDHRAPDFVLKTWTNPPRISHDDRRIVLKREDRDRFVRRGQPPEILNVHPVLTSVL